MGHGTDRRAALAIAGTVALAAAVLLAMGRPPTCTCGTVRLWADAAHPAENSQQLADWYSLGHVVHGLLFYAAGALALRGRPRSLRLVVAVALEAMWEVVENAPAVIGRYRAATIAVGYAGDSLLNSLGDIAFMATGFAIAGRLPARWSIALGIALELAALAAIRDGLALNVLMLVHPVAAVRAWQAAA